MHTHTMLDIRQHRLGFLFRKASTELQTLKRYGFEDSMRKKACTVKIIKLNVQKRQSEKQV